MADRWSVSYAKTLPRVGVSKRRRGRCRQHTFVLCTASDQARSGAAPAFTLGSDNRKMIPIIRTIIADSERLARKKLRILLSMEPGVEIVAECREGKQTVAAVKTHNPDLLLLDIRMPNEDGFQVLHEIPTNNMPLLIFTTAYDRYAIRAFEAHALDCLLKPFDRERLHRAIERARTELLKLHDGHLTDRILDLLAETKHEAQRTDRRLAIKAGGRVVFLDLDEIDWIEAAANYVKLNVGRESYVLREGIGHISDRLDAAHFVRVHRSTIVNVRKIKALQPCNAGEYIAVLKDGKELSCGRSYRLQLQKLIESNL
jgi:two-component system LytT family response regulator